jgi:hypothetical protein
LSLLLLLKRRKKSKQLLPPVTLQEHSVNKLLWLTSLK